MKPKDARVGMRVKVQDHHRIEERRGREDIKPESELERRVERTDALVQTTIGRLSRSYPEQTVGKAALVDLQQMRPHLEGALRALSRIEERRKLTDKELACRRAFKTLSELKR